MKFSEYVLETEIDEGIKDKVRDAAIKVGRKLGVKKAKDAETSGEKSEREQQERDAIRLKNAKKSIDKAEKIVVSWLEKNITKFANPKWDGKIKANVADRRTEDLVFKVGVFDSDRVNSDKLIGALVEECKKRNLFITNVWYDDSNSGKTWMNIVFGVPSNPAMIR